MGETGQNGSKSLKTIIFIKLGTQLKMLRKSMEWFLYDNGLRRERVKPHQWLPDKKRIMFGCHLFNNCN